MIFCIKLIVDNFDNRHNFIYHNLVTLKLISVTTLQAGEERRG